MKRISYNENIPPIVQAVADIQYGPSPLRVQFEGSNSFDPQQDSIQFLWEFGDGTTSTLPDPSHIFETDSGQPKSYQVQLTITDELGASTTKKLLISLNNTPPTVQILSLIHI